MKKMIVGRRVEYVEVYEIDVDRIPSIREDLDSCKRVLWSTDPILSQELKTPFDEKGEESPIKFLGMVFDRISENPVYPVPECYLLQQQTVV